MKDAGYVRCKWLPLQYGLTPVTGDGGVGTTRWQEPEDTGAYQNLEHGDVADSLHIRHGRVRDRRFGRRFFTTGKSRTLITVTFIQHFTHYCTSGHQWTYKLLNSKSNTQNKHCFVHYSLIVVASSRSPVFPRPHAYTDRHSSTRNSITLHLSL